MKKSDALLTILHGMCANPMVLRSLEDAENYGERLALGAESLASHFRTVMEDYEPDFTYEAESEDPDEYEDEQDQDQDEEDEEQQEEPKPKPEEKPAQKPGK